MKKIFFIVTVVGLLVTGTVFAQSNPTTIVPTINPSNSFFKPCDNPDDATCYKLIEPLPQSDGTMLETIDTNIKGQQDKGLGGFVVFIIQISTAVAGVISIAMLTVYGFQYAANDSNIANLEVLKSKITSVILGLMLLLGIFIILNTINPDLLVVEPNIDQVKLEAALDDTEDPTTEISTPQQIGQGFTAFKQFAASNNIYCPGSGGASAIPQIAESMMGKITYSMDYRFSHGPGDTWYLDCSGFVHTVYQCAGLPSPGTYTGSIFSQRKSASGATAKIGDLIGWTAGDGGKKYGHVIMYIGNGKTIESHGGDGKNKGKALIKQNINTAYRKYLKYIRPVN